MGVDDPDLVSQELVNAGLIQGMDRVIGQFQYVLFEILIKKFVPEDALILADLKNTRNYFNALKIWNDKRLRWKSFVLL